MTEAQKIGTLPEPELDRCFATAKAALAYVYYEEEPGRRSAAKLKMLLAKSKQIVVISMTDGSYFACERLIAFTPWYLDAVSGSSSTSSALGARGPGDYEFAVMHVYLSPHNDDVCFSIGNLVSRLGGHLVNLFTRSRYVGANMELPSDEQARIEVISQLRRREDQLFAEAVGLVRHDLGLWEPALMGHGPFDLVDVEIEADALSARLMPFILSILPTEDGSNMASLYCPIGIGGHRNHVSTLLAIRNAYNTLRRRCTVFLYEDLPYASNPRWCIINARQDGLRRAANLFVGVRFSSIVMPLSADESERKIRLINLYASQHAHAPSMVDFTPASGRAPGLHEIVWKVSPVD